MERERVDSTNIHSIGMDGNTLTVQFKSGAVYQYAGVESVVYLALLHADSKGRYLHERIKSNYAVTRLPDAPLSPPLEAESEQSDSLSSNTIVLLADPYEADLRHSEDAALYPADRFRSAYRVVKRKEK